MQVRVAALLPPSNIERIVSRLQETIYSSFGTISAMALPVMIPLGFIPTAVSPESFRQVLNDAREGFSIHSARYRKEDSSVYLSLIPEPEASFRRIVERLELNDSRSPFPPYFGFFLCDIAETEEAETDLADFPEVPSFRFASFHFALIDLRFHRLKDSLWHHVEWELLVKWRCLRPRTT